MWQALSAQKQQYRVGYSICAIVYLAIILQFIYLFFKWESIFAAI